MFKKHVDPGLPPVPPLMVDEGQREAYFKIRAVEWRSVERARIATGAVIFLHGIVTIFLTWLSLPASSKETTRLLLAALLSLVGIAVSARIMRAVLPGFLSRQVFARRLKIAFSPDWIAFKSSYYDNGVRISRRMNGRSLTVQAIVEDDVEAKAHAETLPARKQDGRIESRKHLSQASCLMLMLRTGAEPGEIDELSTGRRFRTIPVAGMDKKTAERLVVLINAAMELTRRKTTYHSNDLSGRDLDLGTIK